MVVFSPYIGQCHRAGVLSQRGNRTSVKLILMATTTSALGSKRSPVTATATGTRRKRPFLLDLYSTAVGKKYVMAISGIAMMGFVLFHMIGNLKMYMGATALNHYAEFLKELLYPIAPKGVVLWILRGGLITMLFLHQIGRASCRERV